MKVKKRTVPVLLLEDKENLGEVGDIVDVKPGYARNYLLPTGQATIPTASALQMIERAKNVAAEKRAKRAAEAAELAAALADRSITLEERASEEGHLFGSVGVARIVEALAADGLAVGEKMIALEEPIKELGIFNVPVKLSPEHTVELRVWVVEPSAE